MINFFPLEIDLLIESKISDKKSFFWEMNYSPELRIILR